MDGSAREWFLPVLEGPAAAEDEARLIALRQTILDRLDEAKGKRAHELSPALFFAATLKYLADMAALSSESMDPTEETQFSDNQAASISSGIRILTCVVPWLSAQLVDDRLETIFLAFQKILPRGDSSEECVIASIRLISAVLLALPDASFQTPRPGNIAKMASVFVFDNRSKVRSVAQGEIEQMLAEAPRVRTAVGDAINELLARAFQAASEGHDMALKYALLFLTREGVFSGLLDGRASLAQPTRLVLPDLRKAGKKAGKTILATISSAPGFRELPTHCRVFLSILTSLLGSSEVAGAASMALFALFAAPENPFPAELVGDMVNLLPFLVEPRSRAEHVGRLRMITGLAFLADRSGQRAFLPLLVGTAIALLDSALPETVSPVGRTVVSVSSLVLNFASLSDGRGRDEIRPVVEALVGLLSLKMAWVIPGVAGEFVNLFRAMCPRAEDDGGADEVTGSALLRPYRHVYPLMKRVLFLASIELGEDGSGVTTPEVVAAAERIASGMVRHIPVDVVFKFFPLNLTPEQAEASRTKGDDGAPRPKLLHMAVQTARSGSMRFFFTQLLPLAQTLHERAKGMAEHGEQREALRMISLAGQLVNVLPRILRNCLDVSKSMRRALPKVLELLAPGATGLPGTQRCGLKAIFVLARCALKKGPLSREARGLREFSEKIFPQILTAVAADAPLEPSSLACLRVFSSVAPVAIVSRNCREVAKRALRSESSNNNAATIPLIALLRTILEGSSDGLRLGFSDTAAEPLGDATEQVLLGLARLLLETKPASSKFIHRRRDGYRLLISFVLNLRAREAALQRVRELVDAAGKVPDRASALSSRLELIAHLLVLLPPAANGADSVHLLNEATVALNDPNAKTRQFAYEVVSLFGSFYGASAESRRRITVLIASGVAGQTAAVVSSALLALARLFHARPQFALEQKDVLPVVLNHMDAGRYPRQVVSAATIYIRVLVASLPRPELAGAARLILPRLLPLIKTKHRAAVRFIFRRMGIRIGAKPFQALAEEVLNSPPILALDAETAEAVHSFAQAALRRVRRMKLSAPVSFVREDNFLFTRTHTARLPADSAAPMSLDALPSRGADAGADDAEIVLEESEPADEKVDDDVDEKVDALLPKRLKRDTRNVVAAGRFRQTGQQYSATRASGDVMRRGQTIDPYAYLPLTSRRLSRDERALLGRSLQIARVGRHSSKRGGEKRVRGKRRAEQMPKAQRRAQRRHDSQMPPQKK